jgi:hypothetical protein
MMIMSAVDSTFFTLNETATAIWQAADGTTPLSKIVANDVCSDYDVDAETAVEDAMQFITELSTHGILMVSDQPIIASTEAPGASR